MVPSSLKIAMQFGADRLASYANKIEFVETGGAPMSPSDMIQLCSLLPSTRLFNTYASTESGIVATYNFNNGSCAHGCVGHAMKHSIIQISPEGQILCSGRTLMSGYFKDQELTEKVLKDGVLTMTDTGYIDEFGMLHISGRNDDVINTGAYKVEPTEIENVAFELPFIKDCICVAAHHPIMGFALKLLYVLHENNEVKKKDIALYLKSKLESYKVPLFYEAVTQINMTYNGKKDRKSYRNYEC
jgi:acyl-CoA synthetase (AMP-forming)/AMP-acid ligase II